MNIIRQIFLEKVNPQISNTADLPLKEKVALKKQKIALRKKLQQISTENFPKRFFLAKKEPWECESDEEIKVNPPIPAHQKKDRNVSAKKTILEIKLEEPIKGKPVSFADSQESMDLGILIDEVASVNLEPMTFEIQSQKEERFALRRGNSFSEKDSKTEFSSPLTPLPLKLPKKILVKTKFLDKTQRKIFNVPEKLKAYSVTALNEFSKIEKKAMDWMSERLQSVEKNEGADVLNQELPALNVLVPQDDEKSISAFIEEW